MNIFFIYNYNIMTCNCDSEKNKSTKNNKKSCIDCNSQVNGIDLDIATGSFANFIGKQNESIGLLVESVLDYVDFKIDLRILESTLSIGLENIRDCNKDKKLEHRLLFGIESCEK